GARLYTGRMVAAEAYRPCVDNGLSQIDHSTAESWRARPRIRTNIELDGRPPTNKRNVQTSEPNKLAGEDSREDSASSVGGFINGVVLRHVRVACCRSWTGQP